MRCINLDWLEVSCEESARNFPCNAEYFREQGYFVKEREYGTRVWSQVFTLEDADGHPWIEVRRCPPSGASSFTGLTEYSSRLIAVVELFKVIGNVYTENLLKDVAMTKHKLPQSFDAVGYITLRVD